MSNSITEFVNLLSSQIDRGIYVWGGNGENLSEMRELFRCRYHKTRSTL